MLVLLWWSEPIGGSCDVYRDPRPADDNDGVRTAPPRMSLCGCCCCICRWKLMPDPWRETEGERVQGDRPAEAGIPATLRREPGAAELTSTRACCCCCCCCCRRCGWRWARAVSLPVCWWPFGPRRSGVELKRGSACPPLRGEGRCCAIMLLATDGGGARGTGTARPTKLPLTSPCLSPLLLLLLLLL